MDREVKPKLVRKYLERLNATASPGDVSIYADYFASYAKAAANIAENGDVCQHPRTGQPIANPFADVRDRSAAMLRKIALNTGTLWNGAAVYGVSIGAAAPTKDSEFLSVLAFSEEEAGAFAMDDLDQDYPQVVWVSSDGTNWTKYNFE